MGRTITIAAQGPVYRPGDRVEIVPMSVMRKKIAEHMVMSAHTSPHVYSVYEVNFGKVTSLREKKKGEYEAAGAKLTFTAFIAKAIVDALRQFPMVNASIAFHPLGADNDSTITLSANNIFDVEARRHASLLKDYAPLSGRDFRITARVTF